MRMRSCVCCSRLAALPALAAASAAAAVELYAGKQIKLVVGSGPGGGYDIYARLLARHLPRYLPGNPTIVVQNMPGAGSLRAANYLYNVAPKDGTVIGTFAHDLPLVGLLGNNGSVQFDPRKFTWLGSPSSFANDAYLLIVRPGAPVKSCRGGARPGRCAAPGRGLGGRRRQQRHAILMRDALGFNLKLIPGYPDSTAMFLAMDRGEIDARFTALSVLR